MQLSPHFALYELTHSITAERLGIRNEPDAEQLENLIRLCTMTMEPVRTNFGDRVVDCLSGLRVPALNGQTPGSSKTSDHQTGCALDFRIRGVPVGRATAYLATINENPRALCKVPFDQLIMEFADPALPFKGWTHISNRKTGNRGMVLTATAGADKDGNPTTIYTPGLPSWATEWPWSPQNQ